MAVDVRAATSATWHPASVSVRSFDLLGLKPALVEGRPTLTRAFISVEVIAQANPPLDLVLDRDAVTKDGSNTPAETVINDNAALQNDCSSRTSRSYAPNDTTPTTDHHLHGDFNSLADAEAAQK